MNRRLFAQARVSIAGGQCARLEASTAGGLGDKARQEAAVEEELGREGGQEHLPAASVNQFPLCPLVSARAR